MMCATSIHALLSACLDGVACGTQALMVLWIVEPVWCKASRYDVVD